MGRVQTPKAPPQPDRAPSRNQIPAGRSVPIYGYLHLPTQESPSNNFFDSRKAIGSLWKVVEGCGRLRKVTERKMRSPSTESQVRLSNPTATATAKTGKAKSA